MCRRKTQGVDVICTGEKCGAYDEKQYMQERSVDSMRSGQHVLERGAGGFYGGWYVQDQCRGYGGGGLYVQERIVKGC